VANPGLPVVATTRWRLLRAGRENWPGKKEGIRDNIEQAYTWLAHAAT
jgi:hypothetical protein